MKENNEEKDNVISQILDDFKTQGDKKTTPFWEEMKKNASFRPTIFIGIGGFGCQTIRELKQTIMDIIPSEDVRQGFGFIGIDTHPMESTDILTTNEYIGVIGIEPHVVASSKDNRNYLGWYNKLPKGNWKARSISGGAGQVRAVGRIAFLNPPTLNKFVNILNSTFSRVSSFKEFFHATSSPKVYLISSLAGGTGSGMFLDVSIITTEFLKKKVGADPSRQSILVTADPFDGVVQSKQMPDLYANTYLTLKDIYGLSGANIKASYKSSDYENIQAGMNHIPNPIFIVSNINNVGKVVFKNPYELRGIVVSYLLFEILTPIEKGGAKVQDGENEGSDKTGKGEMKTMFSSFGSVRFGVPSKEIKDCFSKIIILKAIEKELSNELSPEEVYSFINNLELGEAGSDQLQEMIRKVDGKNEIKFIYEVKPDVENVRSTEITNICKSIWETKSKEVKDSYYVKLEEIAKRSIAETKKELDQRLEKLLNSSGISTCVNFIAYLNILIKDEHQKSLIQELAFGKEVLAKTKEQTNNSIGNIELAAQTGFISRKGKIKMAVDAFEIDLTTELNQQIKVWSMELGLSVYDNLLSHINELYKLWQSFEKKNEARKSYINKELQLIMLNLEKMADINHRGKGNRLSIVNVPQILKLYEKFIGKELGDEMANRLRQEWKKNDAIKEVFFSEDSWCKKNLFNLPEEINSKLSEMNIISVFEEFYSDDKNKSNLLETIFSLGAPLFHLDNNEREEDYSSAWVIAVNDEMKEDIIKLLGDSIPAGAGKSIASYPTKDEVILYNIEHGYTPHSLKRMSFYYSNYSEALRKYKEAKEGYRPYYARLEAETWPELIPISKEEEDIRKWFAIGRALSFLFPTKVKEDGKPDQDKNEAFIYSRGNFFYLNTTVDFKTKKIKLGQGLQSSIETFGENEEYQEYMQTLIENLISEKGVGAVRKRLQEEYLPILESEIEKSSKDPDRSSELEELKVAIRKYLDKELIVSNV